jgi:hypothetical protein
MMWFVATQSSPPPFFWSQAEINDARRALNELASHNRENRDYDSALVEASKALLKRSYANLASCVPRYP